MPENNRIRELLAERQESQRAFADRAGISFKTVWNVMTGRPCNRSTRRLIAQALEVPEDQVFFVAPIHQHSNDEQVQATA